MSEHKKKQQRIYDLLHAETKPKFRCVLYTKQRKYFFQKKSILSKRKSGKMDKKRKEGFLTAPVTAIKKNL